MSAGDSDAMARLASADGVDDAQIAAGAASAGGAGAAGPGADDAVTGAAASSAGNAGAEGAAAAGAGAEASGTSGPDAASAGAASAGAEGAGGAEGIAAAAAPFIEVIEASANLAPEMPGDSDSDEAAVKAKLLKIASDLRAYADAERIVAAVQDGEAASLAEAARILEEEKAEQEEWPTLGAAKQHPKRRRSFTPAAKAASSSGGPNAGDEPRDPSSGDLGGREIPGRAACHGSGAP